MADVKRNGREAIESLQRESFDIVFLDIQMPGLTGIEVVALKPIVCWPLFLLLRLTSLLAVLSIFKQLICLETIRSRTGEIGLTRAQDRVRGEGWVSGKETLIGAIADLRAPTPGVVSPTSPDYGKLPIKDGGHTHLLPHNSIEWIDAAGDYMCVHAEGNVHILRPQ